MMEVKTKCAFKLCANKRQYDNKRAFHPAPLFSLKSVETDFLAFVWQRGERELNSKGCRRGESNAGQTAPATDRLSRRGSSFCIFLSLTRTSVTKA